VGLAVTATVGGIFRHGGTFQTRTFLLQLIQSILPLFQFCLQLIRRSPEGSGETCYESCFLVLPTEDAPSATARGAMDRWMDGQTKSFAAVAAAVLIPFAVNAIRCCHRNKRLCKLLLLLLLLSPLSLFAFTPLSLSLSSVGLSCPFSAPTQLFLASQQPPTTKSLVWSFFVFYDSPALSPRLALRFFSELPGSITGKKLCSQMGSTIFDQKHHHMTEFIAPAPTAVAVTNHAHWINTTIDTSMKPICL
jgi:hypothetical protein